MSTIHIHVHCSNMYYFLQCKINCLKCIKISSSKVKLIEIDLISLINYFLFTKLDSQQRFLWLERNIPITFTNNLLENGLLEGLLLFKYVVFRGGCTVVG